MSVRLIPGRNPAKRPEYTLWAMTKDSRRVEARTRLAPGGTELICYMARSDGTLDLLWSQVLEDGRAVNELAQMKQREFEVRGWTLEPAPPEWTGPIT